jgi:hypothetical protein
MLLERKKLAKIFAIKFSLSDRKMIEVVVLAD